MPDVRLKVGQRVERLTPQLLARGLLRSTARGMLGAACDRAARVLQDGEGLVGRYKGVDGRVSWEERRIPLSQLVLAGQEQPEVAMRALNAAAFGLNLLASAAASRKPEPEPFALVVPPGSMALWLTVTCKCLSLACSVGRC